MRTEKLNRIAKKLRWVSKVQDLEQEYAALAALLLLAKKKQKQYCALAHITFLVKHSEKLPVSNTVG